MMCQHHQSGVPNVYPKQPTVVVSSVVSSSSYLRLTERFASVSMETCFYIKVMYYVLRVLIYSMCCTDKTFIFTFDGVNYVNANRPSRVALLQ